MSHKTKILFCVDAMLGNIARKLRLLGYDSKYFSDINDDDLIKLAKEENRIIISKDNELLQKAKRMGIESILVTKINEIEQFLEIFSQKNLNISQINGDTARCPKCNSITECIEKNTIKEKIPPKVFENNERFWICKNCHHVYWEGTHIINLQKFVGEINERLQ